MVLVGFGSIPCLQVQQLRDFSSPLTCKPQSQSKEIALLVRTAVLFLKPSPFVITEGGGFSQLSSGEVGQCAAHLLFHPC